MAARDNQPPTGTKAVRAGTPHAPISEGTATTSPRSQWHRDIGLRDVIAAIAGAIVGALVLAIASHFIPIVFSTAQPADPVYNYSTELYEDFSVARIIVANVGLGAAHNIRLWVDQTPSLTRVSVGHKTGFSLTQLKDCNDNSTPLQFATFANTDSFCAWIPSLPASASVTFVLTATTTGGSFNDTAIDSGVTHDEVAVRYVPLFYSK